MEYRQFFSNIKNTNIYSTTIYLHILYVLSSKAEITALRCCLAMIFIIYYNKLINYFETKSTKKNIIIATYMKTWKLGKRNKKTIVKKKKFEYGKPRGKNHH